LAQSLSFEVIVVVEVVESADEAKAVLDPKIVPVWMKRKNRLRTTEVETNETNVGDHKLNLVLS